MKQIRVGLLVDDIGGDPDASIDAGSCGHSGYPNGSYLRALDVATGGVVCAFCLPRQIRDGKAILAEPERIAEEVSAWPRNPVLMYGGMGAYVQPPGRQIVMALRSALAAHEMGPAVSQDELGELERALAADPESRSRLAELLKGTK
jgi:hypothetical protein